MAGVITEIAAECGVSEQAVRAWCRRNHVAKDAKGSFAISESQKTAIYQHYLGVERKEVSQPAKASCETTLIAMLQGMGQGDPAVIVVRDHFVSVYWYDHIRIENLREEMLEYACLCGVPALGVGLYDDTNFSIYAVCNAGKSDARGARGEYLFDFEDITEVKAEDICDIVNAPFYLEGLQKALAADDGETMAALFEEGTGLPILMRDDECREHGMKALYQWGGAAVYSER